jgi:hypothetical protein
MFAPEPLYPSETATNEEILPALRDLLSQCSAAAQEGPEALSEMLYTGGYLPFRPASADVEAAREALFVEGRVLA